jgi:integrase/recombinase XerD
MPPPTLQNARDRFMAFLRVECGLADNTLEAYARDLRDLLDDLAGHGVTRTDELGPRTIVEHLARLRTVRGLATSSIARHVATMRIFCRFLAANGETHEDIAELIERPSRWQRIPKTLSEQKVRALLDAPRAPGRRGAEGPPRCGCGTGPCSSCCTPAGCAPARPAR